MQTIPDRVLDAIAAAKPWTAHVIDKLRANPDDVMAGPREKWIAQQAMHGNFPAGLGGHDMMHLAACYYGHPWSGDWVRTADAAEILGVTDSRIRQRILAGELPHIKRGKTWYVRREALAKSE